MQICGMDLSINSPGKVILNLDNSTFDVKSVSFFGYNQIKKRTLTQCNIKIAHIDKHFQILNMCERVNIATNILNESMEEVSIIAIEGYSYGSEGRLFEIGEFTGGVKQFFYNQGKRIICYPPNCIKQFATGSGGADKIKMKLAFKNRFPTLYPIAIDNLPDFESPQSDLIDAFFIAMLLRFHIMYEKGLTLDQDILLALIHKSKIKSKSIAETKSFRRAAA
jgi:Holliday junction resolvasome RuvABC endonuclease subunit